MPNLVPSPQLSPVRILETNELARGGITGNMNEQAIALLNCIEYLRINSATKQDLASVKTANYYRSYLTLAAANEDISNIPLNASVRVLSAEDGGDYYKESELSTELTKSEYDPINQSKAYTDLVKELLEKFTLNEVLILKNEIKDILLSVHIQTVISDDILSNITEFESTLNNLHIANQLHSLATNNLSLDVKDSIDDINNINIAIQILTTAINSFDQTENQKLINSLHTQVIANELNKLDGFDPDLSNGITQTIDGLYTLPEPKSLVKINLITSDIIPTAKGDVKNGNVTIDIDGQILRTACQYEVQGSSSALYPKKNLTFGFFADENYEDEVLVKIGELLPHQELVFKANWIDHTHTRNTGANRIWEQMQHSRKTHPLRDIDHSYIGTTGVNALDTGALGHVKGYACVVYVNDVFYGLGDLNIGKKRQNYNLPKNKPEKIFLELNHWTEISVLDTVNTGWNGSQIVEFKAPSTVTAQTQQYVQYLRDFSLLQQTDLNNVLPTRLDKNNIIDFMLFADFVATTDLVTPNSNEIKNANLISWNGTKWFFMPYDLDTVFGLRYDGTMIDVQPTTSFMNGTFWTKIKTAYMADIEARYAELRANIFTVNNVAITLRDLTSKYSTELYTAELAKWPTLPSINITSINQILEWTSARITYLDSKYNFSK